MQGPLSEGYSVAMEQQLGKQGEGTQRDCGRVEKKKKRKENLWEMQMCCCFSMWNPHGVLQYSQRSTVCS